MTTTDLAKQDNGRSSSLEQRIADVGGHLGSSLVAVLGELPEGEMGPQRLARALGLDKVLMSRLLKAVRSADPIAVAYHAPGPEPLRRFLKAAKAGGAKAASVKTGLAAVDAFDDLIRGEAGDRSSLTAMISAWLPEARFEFELRRKQAAYRAMSELKGVSARVNLSTVILHPTGDGAMLDVVWLSGLLGVTRLRPDAPIKITTRRFADATEERRPETLSGQPIEDIAGLRLDEFCQATPAELEVREVNGVFQYLMAGSDFGPKSATDLLLAEVNRAEMPDSVPKGSGRKGFVFSGLGTPSRTMVFDVLLHRDVYAGSEPELYLYDTRLDGLADVNDPTRDIDRFDSSETIQVMGRGLGRFRSPAVARYPEMLAHVFTSMSWDESEFRGYRVVIEYPIYGSQVVAAFTAPEAD